MGLTDAHAAELYDLLYPWDPDRWPADAGSVLDVGCGTGGMLHHARDRGHTGRLTFTGTTADADGTVLRVDRTSLRFLAVPELDAFLAEAGFTVEERYGDWRGSPVTADSREIVTVARRR